MEIVVKENGNNFIWCYRKDCIFYENENQGVDAGGKFSTCKKEEVIIGKNGKCESYSEKIINEKEDKNFYMLREKQDYIEEVKRAGGKVK